MIASGLLWGLAALAAEEASAGSGAGPAGGVVVDRLVAVVDNQPITLSQLKLEARVLLVERGGAEAARAPLDPETLRSTLRMEIVERLQTLEADRLHAFPVSEDELRTRLQQFEEKIGGPRELTGFLRQVEADPADLAEILGREIRAARILDSKVRLRAQVSEADIRRELGARRQDYPADLEQARPLVRERLTRQRYAELARQELARVRAAGSVRILAPFAKGALPP